MPYGTVNADLMTTSDGVSSAGVYGFKNRIINGDMRIDQRNAGASVTATTSNLYTVDRWQSSASQNSKYTFQQNAGAVTPPVGFTKYLGFTSSSAYSVLTGDYFAFNQNIEGLNVIDLAWGTASAATVTLSFWVRSSLTGSFGGSLANSAATRSYPFTYTINAANTWEQKSVTIAGDTSGTWLTDNGIGIRLIFSLGCGATYSGTAGAWAGAYYIQPTGSTSVVGTNGATFYITGVQLEKGSTATSFDYLDYGRSLIQCQRYCHAYSSYTLGRAQSADTVYGGGVVLSPTMRATPTLRSGATFAVSGGSAGTPQILSGTGYTSSPDNVYISNASANWTVNTVSALTGTFEAEL